MRAEIVKARPLTLVELCEGRSVSSLRLPLVAFREGTVQRPFFTAEHKLCSLFSHIPHAGQLLCKLSDGMSLGEGGGSALCPLRLGHGIQELPFKQGGRFFSFSPSPPAA